MLHGAGRSVILGGGIDVCGKVDDMLKRIKRCVVVAMVLALGGRILAAAQDGIAQEAVETDLAKIGIAAMVNHKRVEPGKPLEYFFVIQFGPDTNVGCGRTKLQATKGEDGIAYRYENECVLAFPGGAQILSSMRATLRANLEPVEVYGSQWQVPPEGEGDVRKIYQRVKVGAEKVSITIREGDRKETSEAPRPQAPFIYGVETLLTLIDRDKYPEFLVRELAPETGVARELVVTLETWSDGTPTYVTRTSANTGSYQLWFDANGRFERWVEGSMPFMFIRTTKETFEGIAARYGLGRIAPTPLE